MAVTGRTAEVTAFDYVTTGGGVCAQLLVFFGHKATVVFREPGTAEISFTERYDVDLIVVERVHPLPQAQRHPSPRRHALSVSRVTWSGSSRQPIHGRLRTGRAAPAAWLAVFSWLCGCVDHGADPDTGAGLTPVEDWTTKAEVEFGDRFEGDALFGSVGDVEVRDGAEGPRVGDGRDWRSYPTSSIRRSRPRTFAAAARVSRRMWSLSGSRIRSNWLRLVRIA